MGFFKELTQIQWVELVICGLFVGWNGIQLVLSPMLVIDLFDWYSVVSYLKSLFYDNTGFIPLTVFLYLSSFIIFSFLHVLSEARMMNLLNHKTMKWKESLSLSVNFFLPVVYIFLILMFLALTAYFVVMFFILILLGFGIEFSISINQLIYRIFLGTMVLVIVMLMPLIDIVMPLLTVGYTFNRAYRKMSYAIKHFFWGFFIMYLMRFIFMMVAFGLYLIFMKYALLPVVKVVLLHLKGESLLYFRAMYGIKEITLNVLTLISGILISQVGFFLIGTPLYIFQRFFMKSIFLVGDVKKLPAPKVNEEFEESPADEQ